jgi:hypothetical protein
MPCVSLAVMITFLISGVIVLNGSPVLAATLDSHVSSSTTFVVLSSTTAVRDREAIEEIIVFR